MPKSIIQTDDYKAFIQSLKAQVQSSKIKAAVSVDNIMAFLLELGAGFAFVGKQYHLSVGHMDFYIDLLFHHVKLHYFVVVELKTGEFEEKPTIRKFQIVEYVSNMQKIHTANAFCGIQ